MVKTTFYSHGFNEQLSSATTAKRGQKEHGELPKTNLRAFYNAVNKTDFMTVELLLVGVQGSTSTIIL